jgi:predicted lipoprotein with Yx(FWY)xxD motif
MAPRVALLSAAALAGSAVAVVAGMAAASSFTLKIHRNVHVTNDPTKAFRVKPVNTHEAVAVGPSGYAVYTFQGETARHLICTSASCLGAWPLVSPASAKVSKQSGIKGRLGTFHHRGLDLTLNGQPLHYFALDIKARNKGQATGDELGTFGSIWHVVQASAGGASPGTTSSTSPTTPYPPWG